MHLDEQVATSGVCQKLNCRLPLKTLSTIKNLVTDNACLFYMANEKTRKSSKVITMKQCGSIDCAQLTPWLTSKPYTIKASRLSSVNFRSPTESRRTCPIQKNVTTTSQSEELKRTNVGWEARGSVK